MSQENAQTVRAGSVNIDFENRAFETSAQNPYKVGSRRNYGETFRLDLNQSWDAIDIQTGAGVIIPKGSHKAVRMLHRSGRDESDEPWLVVKAQHKDKPVSAGLREAYWRQWEGHHIRELRVTIDEWKENTRQSVRKKWP